MIDRYWEKIFREKGLIYLEKPRVEYSPHDSVNRNRSTYYRLHQKTFDNSLKRYARALREAVIAPTELRFVSPDVGFGLFAADDLPRGAWIGEYTGVIRKAIPAREHNKIDGRYLTDYAFTYPRPLPDGTKLEIDAMLEGNPLRFANHSFKPNASVDHLLFENRWVTFFRARRPIAAGEEICIDYGTEYWTGGFRTLSIT